MTGPARHAQTASACLLGCLLGYALQAQTLGADALRLSSGLAWATTLGIPSIPPAPAPAPTPARQQPEDTGPLHLTLALAWQPGHNNRALGADSLLRHAHNWLVRGRLDLARQNLEKMLQTQPHAPQPWAELGNIALQENQPEEAQRILAQLRQQHPQAQATQDLATLVRVYGPQQETLARMRLLARAGRNQEAADLARSLFPEGPPQTGVLGVEYFRILSSAALQTGSALAPTRQALSQTYARTGDANYRLLALELEQAQDAPAPSILRALETLPTAGLDPYRLQDLWRRVLERLPPSPAAQQHLQRYLQRYPDDATVVQWQKTAQDPAHLALTAAQQALEANQLTQAQAHLNTALRLRPSDPQALGLLGWLRLRQSHYGQAQQLLAQAMANSDTQKWRELHATARLWGLMQQADQARDAGQLERAAHLVEQALQQAPTDPDVLVVLAQIRAQQDHIPAAQTLFERVLALEPGHNGALRGLVALWVQAEHFQAARQLLQAPQHALASNRALRQALLADVLNAQAERLLALEHYGPAVRLLEEAIALTPADAWLRHRLARSYLALGQPREALSVMDEGIAQQGQDSSMRFARALIRSATEDDAGALQDLELVAPDQRTLAMENLLHSSRVRASLAQANNLQDAAQYTALLAQAEAQAADSPELLGAVANAWFARNTPDQGVAVFTRLAQRQGGVEKLPPAVQLDYAALLSRAQQDAALVALLPALHAHPDWVPEQARRLASITLEQRERQVETLAAAGQNAPAAALARQPLWGSRWLPAEQAPWASGRLLLAAQDWPAAAHSLAQALPSQPNNPALRLALGDAYARQGLRPQAHEQAQWLQTHAPVADTTQQLALLRLWQRIAAMPQANALAAQLLQAHPQDVSVLLHAARLERAQDRYAQALGYFQTAQALPGHAQDDDIAQNIAAIEARRQAWVEAGLTRVGKSSTDGISSLHGYELPMVAWWPKGYDGHYFLHADRVQLNAGALPTTPGNAQSYGQVGAWPASAYPAQPGTPRGQGMNVGLGYRGAGWDWDIGTIGLGMPVTNIVGGLSYGQWEEDFNYRVELARRPMTGSLLAYTGVRDPITGTTWGGVVATGISARVGKPWGPYSTSLSASAALLQGKNVANNTRLQLRAAIDRDVWRGTHSHINLGMALSAWRYGKDLSEYSWGHGGYYSPQSYVSASFPVQWEGRQGKLTWLARASLSVSRSSSSSSPHYPGNPALQDQAQQQGRNPFYSAGGSTGTGKSFYGVLEYQLTPQMAIGAQLSLDRSAYYAPTHTLMYMRWLIAPVRAPLANRPRPVQAYSDF